MLKIVRSLGYHIDLFKTPMSLPYDSQKKVSSFFSSLISLGLIIFLLIFFFQSDIFVKQNPISSVQSIPTQKRPKLDFNQENMTIALGLTDYENNIVEDPSVFNLTLYAYGYKGSGQETLYEENRTLVKCKEEFFPKNHEDFSKLRMSQFLCLEKNDFTLEGYWDEDIVKYIDITLYKCLNETSNGNSCKSDEEIHEFFKDKYLAIFFSDNKINVNNYESPIQNIYKTRFFLMDPRISKKITFYFKSVEFNNDDGMIFSNGKSIFSFLFGNFEVDYVSENAEWIGTILLYSSSEIYTVKRRFQKIQEVIANLGGLANALFLMGFLLTTLEKQFIFFKIFIGRVYNMESESSKNKKNLNFDQYQSQVKGLDSTFIRKSEDLRIKPFPLKSKKENFLVLDRPIKKKKGLLRTFFDKIINFFQSLYKQVTITIDGEIRRNSGDRKRFTISFFEFIRVKYKLPFIRLCFKEEIISSAMKIYQKEIDILHIIDKLHEIDKIKTIVMDKNQRKQFKEFPKPNIVRKIMSSIKKSNLNSFKSSMTSFNENKQKPVLEVEK